ncbi:hypothetical protein BRADI_3g44905v3 [Brachypodium distachyon]|uniref:Secreted protein n=1 Tax=Brachypodium distachyon TaxID=15368 RepID=A0A0Q3FJB9_BRADI|nr:hypothetical protein BRADI_3g44905v3 [Brachypodium distachyon]
MMSCLRTSWSVISVQAGVAVAMPVAVAINCRGKHGREATKVVTSGTPQDSMDLDFKRKTSTSATRKEEIVEGSRCKTSLEAVGLHRRNLSSLLSIQRIRMEVFRFSPDFSFHMICFLFPVLSNQCSSNL